MHEVELYHHGVKGQKWGVRRYQNSDGSLNAAGKKRYSTLNTVSKGMRKAGKAVGKYTGLTKSYQTAKRNASKSKYGELKTDLKSYGKYATKTVANVAFGAAATAGTMALARSGHVKAAKILGSTSTMVYGTANFLNYANYGASIMGSSVGHSRYIANQKKEAAKTNS